MSGAPVEAARGVGAGPPRVLWSTTLPQAGPTVAAATFLSFVGTSCGTGKAWLIGAPAIRTLPVLTISVLTISVLDERARQGGAEALAESGAGWTAGADAPRGTRARSKRHAASGSPDPGTRLAPRCCRGRPRRAGGSGGAMRLVVFGLAVSSSWGNGHATLWRGLIGALARAGHEVVFFERDVPWYAENRDLARLGDGAELILYPSWEAVLPRARAEVARADVAMVTSFCPDGPPASELIFETAPGLSVFYDMDTPVTLDRLAGGERVEYLPSQGLGDFGLVLSYTGGAALDLLRTRLGARRTAALYGHVDPRAHRPGVPDPAFGGDLSYIGTFAADRQAALEALFIAPARARPERRFVLAGTGYPSDFPWTSNVFFVRHLPPPDHPAFFASSRLTLNVTRAAMAAMGYCPSGRLFEAAACGVPVLSDAWEGLDAFFTPGEEILTARTTADALAALDIPAGDLARIARAARARVLDEHSSDARARELVALLQGAPGTPVPSPKETA